MTSADRAQRYLIGFSRTRAATAPSPPRLAEMLQDDPDIAVVEAKSQGSLFVVEMTPDRAERLQRQFAGGLIVEKDAPLGLA